jgi:hypothetical protein
MKQQSARVEMKRTALLMNKIRRLPGSRDFCEEVFLLTESVMFAKLARNFV